MPDGYQGRFLHLDLTTQKAEPLDLPPWLREDFVGGKGFGAKLLYDLTPAGCDPLGPENVLMFMTGPLTGTKAPSMRACAVTKSPLTGTFLDSFFGGSFGHEIKFAGYDGLIIQGRAHEPVYIRIENDEVEFRPADKLWGLDALETNRAVKKELGDPEVKVVSIGPAGENLVRFALLSCEYNRQAGRGGAGAVMGAKNLKAVALKGGRLVKVHDPAAFGRAVDQANTDILGSEDCAALTQSGTSYAVPWASEVGLIPFRNYYDQVDPRAEEIGDAGQQKHLFLNKAACFGCPIRCSQMGAIRTGRFAHQVTDIVEYESAAMMGSNLDIHDIRAVAHLVKLCDRLGLDSMSAGGVIGFTFEAVGKGLISPPEGVVLDFGSVEGAEYLIRAMAGRTPPLGDLLAQGVARAAERIGRGAQDIAVHVKGLESPAWGPRGTPGMGLAYMTADRGGCHQRGFMVAYEVGGVEYEETPVETYGLDKKAEMLIGLQNYAAGTDCLVKCDFGGFGVSAESYALLLSAATGRKVEADFFNELGERIWNQTRLFNNREGFGPADDRLPPRFTQEPLPSGPHQGRRISAADMDRLRNDYYRVRGWDGQGRPKAETLTRLGLDQGKWFEVE